MSFVNNTTGELIDLADEYMTTTDLVDKFVGNTLWACGYNNSGQLGTGDLVNKTVMNIIGSSTTWKNIAAGGYLSQIFTIAIKTDGTLWSWGNNNNGQLGLNNISSLNSPVQVGSLTNWSNSKLSAGSKETGIVKADGTLWMFGLNNNGQLGVGDVLSKSSPVQVGSLTNWKSVSCGYSSSFLKTDGTIWTCGYNGNGQLGLNDVIPKRSSPTQVGSLTNWSMFIGDFSKLAIKTDGTLWAWGRNSNGELGLNDLVHRSSPVQVGSLTNWKTVSVKFKSSIAIKTDGTLWVWGYNQYGQFGTNNLTSYSSPVQVGSLTNWSKLPNSNTQMDNFAAIKTDGTLWACGFNSQYQLGQGDTVHRSSPVQVGTNKNWIQVVCASNIIALASNN